MTFAPVVPNLPSTTASLDKKYAPGSPYMSGAVLQALAQLPTASPVTAANTIAPLALYDQTRANRGLMPLNARESALALQTLATQQAATKPRRQGFFSAALSDLRALVGGIPKLPINLLHEAQQLPNLPELIPEATTANPLTTIGNLASLPGFRMIPGSFVANQAFGDKAHGSQGLEGLRAHPLFTALDLLPAAEGISATTKVAKAAEAEVKAANLARVDQALALTGHPGTAILAPEPQALRTVLTKKLSPEGELVPTKLGTFTKAATDAFYSTSTGRAFEATFKERDLPRLESRHTSALRKFADFDVPRAQLPTSINGIDLTPLLDLRDTAASIRTMLQDAKLTPEREELLYRAAEDPGSLGLKAAEQLPDLTDTERAILTRTREFQQQRAQITEGDLTKMVTVNGVPEVYDLPTARKLSATQRTTQITREMVEAREAVRNPTSLGASPVEIRDNILARYDDIQRRRNEGTLGVAQAETLSKHYLEALDEAGWRWEGGDPITGKGATLQQVARPSMDDLTAALRPLQPRYSTISRMIDHIKEGRWSAARADLDAFAQTRAGGTMMDQLPFDIDGLKEELTRLRKRDALLDRSSRYTPKRLEQAERLQARAETQAVPARFTPAVQRLTDEAVKRKVSETYSSSPDLETMIDLASKRIYDPISELSEAELRTLQREARGTWQALRDAGEDPVFFSRRSPTSARSTPYIRVSDTPVTPAAAKARMWDATPYVKDMGVAVSRDALDLIQRRGTEAFLDEFSTSYGKRRADVVADLLPRAEARHLASPSISVQQHLNDLINDRWAPFDASKYGGKKVSPALSISQRDQILVPRVMAENMERLFNPPLPKLTAALDPIMHVFRTSVLPLAPRWHIYNTIGGAVVTAVHDPMAFRYLPEVIRDLWNARGTEEGAVGAAAHIPGAPPSGFGTMPAEARSWDHRTNVNSPYRDRLAATHNYAAGRTLSRWFEQAREGRIGKIKDGASRAIERSYGANQMVDDMYRSAVGISERNRQLRKGATPEMAEAAAVASIRRVFQSWDAMTPMERSVMRTVVPFYGWTAHILKYAMRYPFDHPFRVSVLGSLARAELTDAASGLPDYIRDMVLMGDVRANGVVKALNVGPFNPFRDLPSMFTVAGFLGNLNPILTGVLESVGVNTQQGGPSLYPETQYDPETGRLVVNPSGNLVSNIIGNVLPQAELLTALTGHNEAFNATLKRDPQAAGRLLMSNLGIPVLFKDINVGDALIKAELARYEDEQNARKEALRTGDLSILKDFPGLAAYSKQLQALGQSAAGQQALAQLRPTPGSPGAPTDANLAYAFQAGLLSRSA